ncbi:zf-TFIIB domain-containing protein [Actinosynnema sp. NPDC091369]
MICPKCQDLMRTISRGSVHIEQCENCKGVFLDGGELEQIIAAERAHYAQPYRPEGVPVHVPAAPVPVAPVPVTPVPVAPVPVAAADPTVAVPVDGTPPAEGAAPVEPAPPVDGEVAVAPAGPPPPYQPPPGTHTGPPPPYQPPPGTAPAVPPPPQVYPVGYYDPHYPPRRRRSFLEELLD